MSDISDAKKIAMANAVRQIQESNQRTLTMLKADRFLADADWDMAERDCEMHNPYMHVEGEVRGFLINFNQERSQFIAGYIFAFVILLVLSA